MLVLGTVPILCRVKFRACLACFVCRVHSGHTCLLYVLRVKFRAMYVPLLTSDQPRQEPYLLFAAFFLKFFVSLLPPKNLGEV